MTSDYQLAQVNIGRTRGEMTDPVMAEFVARLPEINALADESPGFVWRLQTEDGDATAVRPYEDRTILINLSVWEDLPGAPGLRLSERPCGSHAAASRMVRAIRAYLRCALVGAGGSPPLGHRGRGAPGLSGGERPNTLRLSFRRGL